MFTNEFISLCQSYAKKRNDVLDETIENSKKFCKYSIEHYSYVLEFNYVKKESVYVAPSSLYCTLKLRKNSVVHYHLTDIIPFLNRKTFKSCYFWNIECPERLHSCFESLETTLDIILPQIAPFTADDTLLAESLFQSYKNIFSLKSNDIDFGKIDDKNDFAYSYFFSLQKVRDEYIFSRYSKFAPYALLLKNNMDKALVKYEKLNQKNKLLEYEKLLIEHIHNSGDNEFHAFDAQCDTSISNKLMSPASGLKAFLICYIISSIFFCSFCAVYNLIASINTIVFLSAPWYVGFLCAGLCSVFGAIAFFSYMPNRHLTKTQRQNFSKILVSKGVKKVSFATFAFSVAAALFLVTMIMISNVRFYKDSIQFEDQSYNYNQVDSVYYIEARYNIYGDRIERASYVILFDDKTSLDLDGSTSVKFTEKEVLPLLKSKGIDVRFADSERDLPWYSDLE